MRVLSIAVLVILAGCTGADETSTSTATEGEVPIAEEHSGVYIKTIGNEVVEFLPESTPPEHMEWAGVYVSPSPDDVPSVPMSTEGARCMESVAGEAEEYLQEHVDNQGDGVTIRYLPARGASGENGPRPAFMIANGTNLNKELVRRGYAIVESDASENVSTVLRPLETDARNENRGIWQCTSAAPASPEYGGTDGDGYLTD